MGPYALFQATATGQRDPAAAVLAQHGDPAVHLRQHQDGAAGSRGVAGGTARHRPRLGLGPLGHDLGPDRQARLQPGRLRRLEQRREQPRPPVRDGRAEAAGLRPRPRRRTRGDHRRRRSPRQRRGRRARCGRRSPAAASASAPSRGRPVGTTTRRRSTPTRTAWRASSAGSRPGRRSTWSSGVDRDHDVHARGQPGPGHPGEQLAVLQAGRLQHLEHGRSGPVHHATADPVPAETPGNPGLAYDPATDRYTYPWKTLKEWDGTCREFVLTGTTACSTAPTSASRRRRRSRSPGASATRAARPSQARRSASTTGSRRIRSRRRPTRAASTPSRACSRPPTRRPRRWAGASAR